MFKTKILLGCGMLAACVQIAYAQNKTEKKGAENFNRLAYPKAIQALEPADSLSSSSLRKLAESYYITGKADKAEASYAKLVQKPDAEPSDFYRYALLLKTQGKYTEATEWLKKFSDLRPEDSRAAEFLANPDLPEKLMKGEVKFNLSDPEINTDGQDFGTAFYKNQVVFTSSREGQRPVQRRWNGNGLPFLDMFVADKAGDGKLIQVRDFQPTLNKKFHEGPASFSANGRKMVFTRNNYESTSRDGARNLELFEATGPDWKNKRPLPFNNADYSVGHPALSQGGDTLFFTSNKPGGYGGTDIYMAVRDKQGIWSEPRNMGKPINTEGNEMFPFYHPSGMLFFASDGHAGLGGLDIFFSIPGIDEKVVNAGTPLNSRFDDFAFILEAQGRKGYVSSNREGGKGNDDIYLVQTLKPEDLVQTIRISCVDASGNAVPEVTLRFFSGAKILKDVISGALGQADVFLPAGLPFKIKGNKPGFLITGIKYEKPDSSGIRDVLVSLRSQSGMYLAGIVTDKQKSPLEGAFVYLLDKKSGEKFRFNTKSDGSYRLDLLGRSLNDKAELEIRAEKSGYLPSSFKVSQNLDHEGKYEVKDIVLEAIQEGSDLAKSLNLKPIYFDRGKYDIRKDAAAELNKVVKVLNQNPGMVLELNSHTDCRGSKEDNQFLSDRRAKSTADYIKKRIKKPGRISAKGFGESKLVNACVCEKDQKSDCSEEAHQLNRRTEFIVIRK